MEATETFKKVISNHLQSVADSDSLFAETLKKPAKNLNECVTYIFNQVKKTGKNGFADDEIFSMAVHYYDEDNIEVGKSVSGKVIVNQHFEADKSSNTNPTKTETPKAKAKKLSKPDEQIYLF